MTLEPQALKMRAVSRPVCSWEKEGDEKISGENEQEQRGKGRRRRTDCPVTADPNGELWELPDEESSDFAIICPPLEPGSSMNLMSEGEDLRKKCKLRKAERTPMGRRRTLPRTCSAMFGLRQGRVASVCGK